MIVARCCSGRHGGLPLRLGVGFCVYKSKNALYVVVKNREKRVTGGRRQGDRCEATGGWQAAGRSMWGNWRAGGREIDVRQLERNGWRKCGSGCVLPVVSGFFTRCGAALHLTRAKHFTHRRFWVQSYEKILKLTNYKQKILKNFSSARLYDCISDGYNWP